MFNHIKFSFILILLSASFAFADNAPQVMVNNKNLVNNTNAKIVESDKTKESSYNSLMFGEIESNWLHQGIKSRDLNIPIGVLLPNLFPESKQSKDTSIKVGSGKDKANVVQDKVVLANSYPKSIYLHSIVYTPDNHWIVWIGDKKITDTTKDTKDKSEFIKVQLLNKDKVVAIWKNFPLDILVPNWKLKLSKMDEGDFYTNNINVVLDGKSSNLAFILKPNQALIPKEFTILEGRPSDKVADSSKAVNKSVDSKNKDKDKDKDKDNDKVADDNLESPLLLNSEANNIKNAAKTQENNLKLFNDNKQQLLMLKNSLQLQ